MLGLSRSRWLMLSMQLSLLKPELRRRSIFGKLKSRLLLLSHPYSQLRSIIVLSLLLVLNLPVVVEWYPLWFQHWPCLVAIVLNAMSLPNPLLWG